MSKAYGRKEMIFGGIPCWRRSPQSVPSAAGASGCERNDCPHRLLAIHHESHGWHVGRIRDLVRSCSQFSSCLCQRTGESLLAASASPPGRDWTSQVPWSPTDGFV
eukprot:scaffold7971_cov296-Pinguiococcus_pyrenoidosus.AAC.3